MGYSFFSPVKGWNLRRGLHPGFLFSRIGLCWFFFASLTIDKFLIIKKQFQVSRESIRSDEGLTLETSAFQTIDGDSTFINSFNKTEFSCFTVPQTQHSFFRN